MEGSRSFLNRWPFKVAKNFDIISGPTVDLLPEEADRFITYALEQTALKDFARIERMNVQQKRIRARGFGSGRMLYPAGAFNESKYKKELADNTILLQTQELRGCIVIFDSDLEDISQIQSEAEYKAQFMQLAAIKAANELEEAWWIGEAHGLNGFATDDIRGLWDGWRYRIVNGQIVTDAYYNKVSGGSHVLDACLGGTSGADFDYPGLIAEHGTTAPYLWEFKYGPMLKAMPSIYVGQLGNMRFCQNPLVKQDYFSAIAARSTPMGDAVLTGQVKPQYGGVEFIDVPLMATNLGDPTAMPSTDGVIGAGDYTDVLLTIKDNLILGIQRQLKMEVERKAADQANYIFYSMRVCPAIENVNSCVLLRCLEHKC